MNEQKKSFLTGYYLVSNSVLMKSSNILIWHNYNQNPTEIDSSIYIEK